MEPRVVSVQSGSNPILTLLCVLLALAVGLVLIVILLPIAIVLGLLAAVYFTIRRALSRVGSPNSRVAGVRTDGRSNVRVVTRE